MSGLELAWIGNILYNKLGRSATDEELQAVSRIREKGLSSDQYYLEFNGERLGLVTAIEDYRDGVTIKFSFSPITAKSVQLFRI